MWSSLSSPHPFWPFANRGTGCDHGIRHTHGHGRSRMIFICIIDQAFSCLSLLPHPLPTCPFSSERVLPHPTFFGHLCLFLSLFIILLLHLPVIYILFFLFHRADTRPPSPCCPSRLPGRRLRACQIDHSEKKYLQHEQPGRVGIVPGPTWFCGTLRRI